MTEIKPKNSSKKEDIFEHIESLIETKEIIEIVVSSELKIHIDKIDQFSDELHLLVDKYKK